MPIQSTPTVHTLDDALENLHGYFSQKLPPRLTVDSGDTIVYKTCDAGWRENPPGQPAGQSLRRRPEGHDGHALSGPVFVRGAMPGDTLQIDIGEIVPSDWGFGVHRPGRAKISGILGGEKDDVKEPWFRHFTFDRARNVYPVAPGIEVPAAPFMGIYAVAPADDGPVPTAFPGPHGANMDCKELGPGTTLYLPVFVPGALFSVGDGHGAQGDGELDGAAIETGMDRLVLRLTVRKDLPIERPCAETATHVMFLGFDEDLDEAARIATRDALRFLCRAYGLTWDEAYNLASLAVDLRVTQVVGGLKGIHAMVPKALFAERAPTFQAG
jgi:acetamidase/formamidase